MTMVKETIPSLVPEQSKKHILLVVRWPGGGIRTFIRYVYRNFEPELFQFTILGPANIEMDVLLDDLQGLDVKTKRMSARPSFYEFFITVAKEVVFGGYHLVHSQGFTSGICASLPAFLSRRPHILTSHDVINGKQFKGIIGSLKRIGIDMAFSLIPVIHSVSNDAHENLLGFFPFLKKMPGKCIVISNGIEVERFLEVEPRDLRAELGIGEQTFLIGFLGRFMSQKGFVYLVEAIEELSRNNDLPKVPLVVAFGEEGFVREERAQIADRGLTQYFRFLPFTPNVAGVIKALDMVAMPSLWEACPLLPMEVLVAGTPLLATSCIGLREVVRNTPAVIVPPRDGKALALRIESFMNNDQKETFTKFVPEAARRFDVTCQAKKIGELMRSIIRQ